MIKEVLAVSTPIPINITGMPGVNASVSVVIGNVIRIVFAVAMLAVLFMLIFGAFQWIISGGEKEKVASARGRITNALIGLAILGLAFVIATVAGNIVGVDLFNLTIPNLGDTSTPI